MSSPIISIRPKSKDGKEVHAYMHKPKFQKELPAIVFVYGGLIEYTENEMRTQLLGNPVITQFLAKGLAVVQTTFRTC